MEEPPSLATVFKVKACIALTRNVYAGESIGYDRAFTAPRDMEIAVMTVGYADGLPRSLSCGVGRVLVKGSYAPIIGKICMDQAVIDISDISAVNPGDEVTLIGCDGENSITVHDYAQWAATVPNEIVSSLGGRLERVFI